MDNWPINWYFEFDYDPTGKSVLTSKGIRTDQSTVHLVDMPQKHRPGENSQCDVLAATSMIRTTNMAQRSHGQSGAAIV